jgi:glycosyltransferase involved in cell wall biosynthesis
VGGVSVRLGYVCQYFTREYRGPVTNLMDELSKSIDVVNYSYIGKHRQYHEGGIHDQSLERVNDSLLLRRYDINIKIGGLLFPKNLNMLLGREKLQVIQSEEYYQPATHTAYRFAKENGMPFIINHRGSEERTRTIRERAFFAAANPVCRKVIEGADAIVCLSEAGKDVLCGIYPQAKGKIMIVPNSIDPGWYANANGGAFRREYNIPAGCPLVLCVARLHPQKRIDLLVRAFAKLKKESAESVLCVVGPWFDKEKAKIDALIRRLDLQDVIFTGPIPNDNVKNAYAASDVVALTSEYEPFGYCLLEAMCQAKPTVAFGIGAMPEIIADGISGYHVPFPNVDELAKRILELLNDTSLAKRMGKAGLSRINERFHIKEAAGRLKGLYEELAKDG